jgi:hypothetical protein
LSNIIEEHIDEVQAKLEPIIHYHKGSFLEKSLPGLKETVVYTYNLTADGTKEKEKYSRQTKKEYLSKNPFSNEEQADGGNISQESAFSDRF